MTGDYRLTTRAGEEFVASYAGWERTERGTAHRFGRGRARRTAADRSIASAVD